MQEKQWRIAQRKFCHIQSLRFTRPKLSSPYAESTSTNYARRRRIMVASEHMKDPLNRATHYMNGGQLMEISFKMVAFGALGDSWPDMVGNWHRWPPLEGTNRRDYKDILQKATCFCRQDETERCRSLMIWRSNSEKAPMTERSSFDMTESSPVKVRPSLINWTLIFWFVSICKQAACPPCAWIQNLSFLGRIQKSEQSLANVKKRSIRCIIYILELPADLESSLPFTLYL